MDILKSFVFDALIPGFKVMFQLQWQGILLCIGFGLITLWYRRHARSGGMQGFIEALSSIASSAPVYFVTQKLYTGVYGKGNER